MATHTGNEGVVQVGANTVAEVRSYTIEETSDTTEDSSMGDSWRTHKATLKSWTASLDVWYDETDTTGQGTLVPGTTVTITVLPEGNTAGDVSLSGSAIVTSKNISANLDGMVEASISVQGTGALTEGTVT